MEATPIPENISPTVRVFIPCAGSCKTGRKGILAKWTSHIFMRLEPRPRAQAMIYACAECGSERVYGLLGTRAEA